MCEDVILQLTIHIDGWVTARLPRPHTPGRFSRWTEATSWVIGILAGLLVIVPVLWYGFPFLVSYLPESLQPTLPHRRNASRFTIAVVHLANDPNQEHEHVIIEELKHLDIEILPLERTITLGHGSQSEQDRERTAHDQARTYLATTEADALIWGYVHTIDGKSASRLYWTTARDTQRSQTAHAPENFRLPDLFWRDLTKVLQLLIAHESAKFTAQQGHFVSDQLAPFVKKVRQLLADTNTRNQSWNADTLATVRLLLANALSTVGTQTGTPEPLVEAINLYKIVLAHNTREIVPLQWATTQNNLGIALQTLGKRENSPERLQAAVTAYQEALKEYTRERVPLQWATTQNNLGNALQTLGERENSPERLQAAVTAYQEALKERTREIVPLDWATTQNNLGNALRTLGERENSPERLQAAVTAYQEALKEYTRERVPLQWAMTQNNLGNALQTLGEREKKAAFVCQALDRHIVAWEVFVTSAPYYAKIAREQAQRDSELLREQADETIASLPGFIMAFEEHVSYSLGPNIQTREAKPCLVQVRIDPISAKGLLR
ncbi:MAG: tetratricopeptide repeat protein, partial [Deltaproteobacteria bacterium]|nr:tetratricopeptide repeat protein [Deltaproteobacteria bacterium]